MQLFLVDCAPHASRASTGTPKGARTKTKSQGKKKEQAKEKVETSEKKAPETFTSEAKLKRSERKRKPKQHGEDFISGDLPLRTMQKMLKDEDATIPAGEEKENPTPAKQAKPKKSSEDGVTEEMTSRKKGASRADPKEEADEDEWEQKEEEEETNDKKRSRGRSKRKRKQDLVMEEHDSENDQDEEPSREEASKRRRKLKETKEDPEMQTAENEDKTEQEQETKPNTRGRKREQQAADALLDRAKLLIQALFDAVGGAQTISEYLHLHALAFDQC